MKLLAIIAILVSLPCTASDKKEISQRYKDKFLVVQRDGLFVGILPDESGPGELVNKISGDQANPDNGQSLFKSAVRKGEMLHVIKPYFNSHWAILVVETVNPHQVERGIGAFRHSSLENGAAQLRFMPSSDFDQVQQQIESWVKVYDSKDAALIATGNTASGVFVKQVKLGMTAAEVESVLGVPETRADLGEKMLYKYSNMTVEFTSGKVSDVR
jgi:hypothetical protein